MAKPRFEDIALDTLILLRDGVWGESVAERHHGLKMLLNVIGMMPIGKKHSRLIAMIEGTNLWFGRVCAKEAADAIAHIRRQLPKGLRPDKASLKAAWRQFPEGTHITL